jgi:hypothetical protein
MRKIEIKINKKPLGVVWHPLRLELSFPDYWGNEKRKTFYLRGDEVELGDYDKDFAFYVKIEKKKSKIDSETAEKIRLFKEQTDKEFSYKLDELARKINLAFDTIKCKMCFPSAYDFPCRWDIIKLAKIVEFKEGEYLKIILPSNVKTPGQKPSRVCNYDDEDDYIGGWGGHLSDSDGTFSSPGSDDEVEEKIEDVERVIEYPYYLEILWGKYDHNTKIEKLVTSGKLPFLRAIEALRNFKNRWDELVSQFESQFIPFAEEISKDFGAKVSVYYTETLKHVEIRVNGTPTSPRREFWWTKRNNQKEAK